MIQSGRRDKLIEIINKEKNISVKELSSTLGFAESTIRSDLNFLDKQGLIKRIHGGAASTEKTDDFDYKKFENRLNTEREEKIKIARKAIKHINNDEVLILDASTTCFELAQLLANTEFRLTILTNGIKVAEVLKNNPNISIVLIGGILARNSYAIEGDFGADILDKFNIHKTFISAHAINIENGMTDFNVYEVQLKRKFIEKSDQIYALIDSSKFDKKSASTICDLSCIDLLISDNGLDQEIIARYKFQGLKIDNN
jgi:DeoR family transcriptional regulator, fructose operon transcriptional repressor